MITVNLYYRGANGSARAFAEEMEESGIADAMIEKAYLLCDAGTCEERRKHEQPTDKNCIRFQNSAGTSYFSQKSEFPGTVVWRGTPWLD